jgi:hypothetical protein
MKVFLFRDSAGTRTQGPYIKSVLLYRLSYEISCPIFRWIANVNKISFMSKKIYDFINEGIEIMLLHYYKTNKNDC